MLVLAVDTSTPTVLAALVQLSAEPTSHPEVLAARQTHDPRAHSEVLTPQVLQCLAETGRTPADLDAVVCGTGPGPYTGLRVGMVTAVAFGDALAIPVHGVCSLDAVAGAVESPAADAELLVVTDARRRELYWARYRDGVRVAGPAVARPDAVDAAGATAVAGSPTHAALFDLPVVGPTSPDPAAMVALAAPALRSNAAPEPLVPLYLRRPDAVAAAPRVPAVPQR
ncbi:tRNA (adenosine(37)-N6)-threonylcarbamoyltransferase complex dimerization subunit type 1 TsaB [Rhodococcus sp. X156]|uniref:tRNA (adenosine(37)-N6)-threonylcarbamoyltransferase complex dimerization subunit type 1 TsaB n=1 Tax=Rhodococcus sp. X156 TaxID=2499145 RepID=UPI000FD7703D|nr:tRNA (adenosine(37)-N6)-threonylcarbamoyltransferase complex dimerization subunit type 1 TsaB [Rhodococcus sp. X156]